MLHLTPNPISKAPTEKNMGALSEFFSHLYTITAFWVTVLVIQALASIRLLRRRVLRSFHKNPISKTRYMALIEEKNPAARFVTKLMPELIECAVCLSKFEEGVEIRELRCKHTFHKDCFDRWLRHDRNTCPLCRNPVLPEHIVIENHRLRSQQEHYYGIDEDQLIFLFSAVHGGRSYRVF